MEITCSLEWNTKTLTGLHRIPDGTLWTIAKETLDMTVSKEYIPWRSGNMMFSSVTNGVRGTNGDYYIGSYTNYASSVWKMPQTSTNWTNPNSKSKWYAAMLMYYKETILNNAINKVWKKEMQ